METVAEKIMNQSLWDLKLGVIYPFSDVLNYHEPIPMGFETMLKNIFKFSEKKIMNQSLWDLKRFHKISLLLHAQIMNQSLWDLKQDRRMVEEDLNIS